MTRDLIEQETPDIIAGLVVPGIGENPIPDGTRITETEGLVEALGVRLGFSIALKIRDPNAGQLFGSGQLDNIEQHVRDHSVDMVVIDCALTPVQQRNLERQLQVKIVDRTGLILEIFGLRARTSEGRLQVEMARILYERSRLVRTWTHLERQRGGRGFLAGPGESQLEADRRMLDRQIARLKVSIEDVRKTRNIQRQGRRKRGKPLVALVGYINAGKSTLFNRLTDSNVFSADMPFATLDPTIREFTLPSGDRLALIDTVGFISELPTTLVDSFRATIEEAMEADMLLHIRDISAEQTDQQAEDVETVLQQLESDAKQDRPPLIEVWNKADLVNEDDLAILNARAANRSDVVLVSSKDGAGFENLLDIIQEVAFRKRVVEDFILEPKLGQARAWLYEQGDVLEETGDENGNIKLKVELDEVVLARFLEKFPTVDVAS